MPPDAQPGEPSSPPVNPAPAAAQPKVAPPAPQSKPGESRPSSSDPDAEPTTGAASSESAAPVKPGEKGLRLNFRGVPLEMVLNYLSEAAGFIIVLETDVRGKVDVWSNQPLDQDEAITLLNTVLNKNGYAALRNGRMLTVISRDDAKKRDTRVVSGSNPEQIPKDDEIVTQILPVRFINAAQLSRDLAPLIPASANVAANEGGNALLITDTQTNIRRIAEILKALDTSIASSYVIRVFALQYADAKSLAAAIKELFQSQETSSRSGDPRAQFFNRFMGGGGPGGGGPGGGGGGGGASGSSGGRAGATRVVAVADERSNALVVSAPEDVMPSIQDLVKEVDTEIEDVTELRVFRLRFADPQETADLLASLFPDTSNTQNNRSQMRFAGGRGGGFGPGGFGMVGGAASTSASSERLLKQTRVVAVADPRTGSVVVSASRTLMEQISQMVAQLDSDPAKKQKVFVFDVENTDPQAVQEVLQSLFPEQNYSSSSMRRTSTTQRQNSNQLNNRQTQTRNQSSRTSTGTRGSSFGGAGGSR
jgi:general secretion pathway protein D